MLKLYPLKFVPILKERVWGGDKLVRQYNKAVPVDEETHTPVVNINDIGESWDLSGMDENDSVIANGFLEESTLNEIIETYMGDLVGDNIFDYFNLHFPILVKMLDVKGFLSVQVHPDDATAFEREYSYGKDELWYVMEAAPEAKIYMGFNRKVTASEFYQKCKDETVDEILNLYHPKKGDCFFIKAGTVHAAGGGLVIAEIQEASDITYRLYDWGREHNHLTARKMHLEDAIDGIDYNKYDENVYYHRDVNGIKNIVDCEHFTVNNLGLKEVYKVDTAKFNSFIFYFCTQGCAMLQVVNSNTTEAWEIKCGESILIPADADDLFITPKEQNTNLLEVHIRPVKEEKDAYIDESVPDHVEGEK